MVEDRARLAVLHDGAAGQDHHARGEGAREPVIVGRDEQRPTGPAQRLQGFAQFTAPGGVQ